MSFVRFTHSSLSEYKNVGLRNGKSVFFQPYVRQRVPSKALNKYNNWFMNHPEASLSRHYYLHTTQKWILKQANKKANCRQNQKQAKQWNKHLKNMAAAFNTDSYMFKTWHVWQKLFRIIFRTPLTCEFVRPGKFCLTWVEFLWSCC